VPTEFFLFSKEDTLTGTDYYKYKQERNHLMDEIVSLAGENNKKLIERLVAVERLVARAELAYFKDKV
jgi:hypothetical protein